ncbi:UNVERIFIED_CONTAM: hypothetical protein Sradi_0199500 [Sesamum radiatum]|uniref:Reverse transcriptase/retrotransposon-derived protein RNase H-like domain-containing protein n=1 Tax=Sesamum radiatum TaxID=300843 RepID=A0AAW2W0Y6_SESRA
MKSHTNLNEVQRLAGHIVALSRFISRSAERNLPFFKALRKNKNFIWDEECQQVFHDLKSYLAELPTHQTDTRRTPISLLSSKSVGNQLCAHQRRRRILEAHLLCEQGITWDRMVP